MNIAARVDVEHLDGVRLHPKEPGRLSLCALPTPVERMTRLLEVRGLDPESHTLLVKRDDKTGLAVSGNKVRKLEYLAADALAQGCDTLVTQGAVQSNHCRATAAVAARLGLKSRLFLRGEKPTNVNGNLLLDELFGAECSFHDAQEYNGDRDALVQRVMDGVRDGGGKPYFIPTGGSVETGSWGYVRAMFELAEQLEAPFRGREVDVFCTVGSCGTHAGCVLGRALAGLDKWRVVGVPVAATSAKMAAWSRELVDDTVKQFGLGLSEADTPVEVLDGFIGPAYGVPTPEGTAAIRDAARHEALVLDPSYTGKTMAGVLHAMQSGFVRDGAVVVFIHTGGSFGLMGAAGNDAGWSA